jgi:ATP-dependent Clp endopeptidase proteolytic subunit ClpP
MTLVTTNGNGMTPEEMSLIKLSLMYDRGLDLDGRTLYIFDGIDESMSESIVMGLNYLSRTDGPITVLINSQGGSVSDMFAIYDTMQACQNEITTIGIGEVCSAAGLLLVGGDYRLVSRNCLFMAHQVMGGYNTDENLNTAEAQIKAVRICWDRWAKCMAEHTARSEAYWKGQLPKDSELWLPAEKMILKKNRIADAIWE